MSPIPPDEHLKAALRHAPDAQLSAPPEVSAQILAAAHRSAGARPYKLSAPPSRWLTTVLAWRRQPQATAAMATVLLAGTVGLLWRGDPPGPGRDRGPDLVAQAPAPRAPEVLPLARESVQPEPPSMRKAQTPRAMAGESAPPTEARAPRTDRTERTRATAAAAPAPAPTPTPARAAAATAERQAPFLSNNQRQTVDADAARSSAEAAASALAPAPPAALAAAPTAGPAPLTAPAAPPAPAVSIAAAATAAPTSSAAPAARAMAQPAATVRMPLALSGVQPEVQALDGWVWSTGSLWRDPDRHWMAALLQSAQGLWRPADKAAPLPGSLQLNGTGQGQVQIKLWLEPEGLLWCSAGGACLRAPLSAQQRLALLEQLAR